jgi:hypothetical protein
MNSLKPMMVCAVALVVASACDRDRDLSEAPQPMTPHESSASSPNEATERELPLNQAAVNMTMTQRAIEAITSARCEREARCKNIGPDASYATMAACKTEVRNEWKDDLDAMECGGLVDREEIEGCLHEIRNENCSNPIQTLGRMGACQSKIVCKEIAAR